MITTHNGKGRGRTVQDGLNNMEVMKQKKCNKYKWRGTKQLLDFMRFVSRKPNVPNTQRCNLNMLQLSVIQLIIYRTKMPNHTEKYLLLLKLNLHWIYNKI